MGTLHVYCNDVTDWVISESAEEAEEMAIKELGYEPDDDEYLNFTQEPDDKVLSIWDEDGDIKDAKTCAEWCKSYGKGFLCSTEY
jgi:hypothetical protein